MSLLKANKLKLPT